ncbi:MAG: sigma-70 family RNA polymerase sigma factor [Rhodospirillales bacterium]|nr:sigma-70 family RNA polymerase sigma factor [Rhodospirillales bacterium]
MNDRAWLEFDKKLRAYVGRRMNSNAVDDVVADILLRLVRSQEKMEGARNPMAWVYRVASHVIADHYRKAASEKRLLAAVNQDIPDAGVTDPTEDTSAALARCLVPMIRNLPAVYGQALMLVDIGGVSQSDAAQQLGLSVSGAKSRVQRGRQKLKAMLLRCCRLETNSRGALISHQSRNASACCD